MEPHCRNMSPKFCMMTFFKIKQERKNLKKKETFFAERLVRRNIRNLFFRNLLERAQIIFYGKFKNVSSVTGKGSVSRYHLRIPYLLRIPYFSLLLRCYDKNRTLSCRWNWLFLFWKRSIHSFDRNFVNSSFINRYKYMDNIFRIVCSKHFWDICIQIRFSSFVNKCGTTCRRRLHYCIVVKIVIRFYLRYLNLRSNLNLIHKGGLHSLYNVEWINILLLKN